MEKNVTEAKIDQVNLYYNELYNMIHEEPPEEKEIKYYFIKNNRCQVTKNAYSYQIKINDQIKIELYFNNRIIKFIDKKSTNLIHIYNYSQLKKKLNQYGFDNPYYSLILNGEKKYYSVQNNPHEFMLSKCTSIYNCVIDDAHE